MAIILWGMPATYDNSRESIEETVRGLPGGYGDDFSASPQQVVRNARVGSAPCAAPLVAFHGAGGGGSAGATEFSGLA